MSRIVVVLAFISITLAGCGNNKNDNDIVVVPESSTTTSTVREEPVVTDSSAIVGTPKVASTLGKVVGYISIPSIGLEKDIREGIDLKVLDLGTPGHYSHSPLPCRAGNSALAGHRTTHGAPFNKLDLLKDGDIINVSTPKGDCTYKYLRTEIVFPNNISVVMPKDNNANLLTLTACHPKGSAKQRIVVTATLINVVVR